MTLSDEESLLVYWVRERNQIYLRKNSGKPKPWTNDEILRKYKFCNVLRRNDRVSRWLLENWYQPNKDHENMLTACTLARQLNNPESLSALGFPRVWNSSVAHKKLTTRAENGLKNFSGAYMITGTLGGTKVEQIVFKVVDPIHNDPPEINPESLEETATNLLSYAGFSTFISGQVVCDLRFGISGEWRDKHTWAPIGPGSRRGMNRLLRRDLNSPMKQAEFSELLPRVQALLKKKLPKIYSTMEAIDVQNCLCEFDKYVRTLNGEGRPKSKYPGDVE